MEGKVAGQGVGKTCEEREGPSTEFQSRPREGGACLGRKSFSTGRVSRRSPQVVQGRAGGVILSGAQVGWAEEKTTCRGEGSRFHSKIISPHSCSPNLN